MITYFFYSMYAQMLDPIQIIFCLIIGLTHKTYHKVISSAVILAFALEILVYFLNVNYGYEFFLFQKIIGAIITACIFFAIKSSFISVSNPSNDKNK